MQVCLCEARGRFGNRCFGMGQGRMSAVLSSSFEVGLGGTTAVGFVGVAIKVEAEN